MRGDFLTIGALILSFIGRIFLLVFGLAFNIIEVLNRGIAAIFMKVFKRNHFRVVFHFLFCLFIFFPAWFILWFLFDFYYSIYFFGCMGLAIHSYFTIYKKEGELFGDARYAKVGELKKAGLNHEDGIVLGRMGIMQELITKPANKDGHVLLVGGSGMGKSKSVAIPTLYSWQGSALVIDIKGELNEVTAQKRPQATYVFDPSSDNCDQYDPIKLIGGNPAEAEEMARVLLPIPANSNDPFWNRAARSIASAAFLDGYYKGQTLQEVAQRLSDNDPNELIASLKGSRYTDVKRLVGAAGVAEAKTLAGIMAELLSHMTTLSTDEGIKKSTSQMDWQPKTLEEEATVYLSIPEHLIKQYRNLFNLILNQVISHLSQREDGQQPPILLLLDEFPRLGHVPQFTELIATLRSRNVHILIAVQSLSQLDELYGINGRKIIADNCDFKMILGAGDPDTQQYFSSIAGQRTVETRSRGSSSGDKHDSYSENRSDTGVPLIRPERFARLDKPILFVRGLFPAQINQAWANSDPKFKKIHEAKSVPKNLLPFPDRHKVPQYMEDALEKALNEMREKEG